MSAQSTTPETAVPVMGLARHRIGIDGEGVTTLVAFPGCTLRCRYCLNPQNFLPEERWRRYTPEQLLSELVKDNLYFLATGGGVTFGGGEPAMRSRFVAAVRSICPKEWYVRAETALNVPWDLAETLVGACSTLMVDVKDLSPDIYQSYTGRTPDLMLSNLAHIASMGRAGDVVVRLPLIPGYNTDSDRDRSEERLRGMGYTRFDRFDYITDIRKPGAQTEG